jgi:hypothetical protein
MPEFSRSTRPIARRWPLPSKHSKPHFLARRLPKRRLPFWRSIALPGPQRSPTVYHRISSVPRSEN